MFHPKQSSLSALMSRVSGKRIGRLLAFIPRHPLLAGAGVLSYLAFADADNSARLYAAVSDKDFPKTALAGFYPFYPSGDDGISSRRVTS